MVTKIIQLPDSDSHHQSESDTFNGNLQHGRTAKVSPNTLRHKYLPPSLPAAVSLRQCGMTRWKLIPVCGMTLQDLYLNKIISGPGSVACRIGWAYTKSQSRAFESAVPLSCRLSNGEKVWKLFFCFVTSRYVARGKHVWLTAISCHLGRTFPSYCTRKTTWRRVSYCWLCFIWNYFLFK